MKTGCFKFNDKSMRKPKERNDVIAIVLIKIISAGSSDLLVFSCHFYNLVEFFC